MGKNNFNHIIFCHLNINSLQNKPDLLLKEIKGNMLRYVDALVISDKNSAIHFRKVSLTWLDWLNLFGEHQPIPWWHYGLY